jgi:hypothetical protein
LVVEKAKVHFLLLLVVGEVLMVISLLNLRAKGHREVAVVVDSRSIVRLPEGKLGVVDDGIFSLNSPTDPLLAVD